MALENAAFLIIDMINFLAWWTHRVLHSLYHHRRRTLVLEVGGMAAGFLVLRPVGDALRIKAPGIYPSFRGQGWGEWPVEQADKQARLSDLKRLELYVSSGNRAALILYTRAGFFPLPRLWLELRLERAISQKGGL